MFSTFLIDPLVLNDILDPPDPNTPLSAFLKSWTFCNILIFGSLVLPPSERETPLFLFSARITNGVKKDLKRTPPWRALFFLLD